MKTKALISVAVNVSPTVLNQEGARHEMDTAFQTGATVEELLEVIQMAVAIANHSVVTGALTLGEEADIPETFGQAEVENQDRIRESFKTKRGYWDAKKEPRLKLDSDHFERYLDLSAYPWEHGVLDDKTRELIYIALDASATHTFEYGVEAHIENAIELGATSGEVMETLQLAASIGLYSVTMGAQTLEQVAQEHDKL
jgi:alkylhydroperoxidase/carboxymuconolactone decarboxylase family protein YurZ